jgi:TRAP-type C4-dicarboxylate transport system substrate-binding protein
LAFLKDALHRRNQEYQSFLSNTYLKKEESMMKRVYLGLMVITAVFLFLSGYPIHALAASQAKEPIELNLATVAPPVGSTGAELKWYAREIEERTNGAVTIKIAWAGTLAGPREMPEAIRMGSIDIAHLPFVAFAPSLVPLHTITMECSAFHGSHPLALWMAGLQLYKEFPEFDAEYAANNMIRVGYRGSGGLNLDSRKKPIRKIEDLKGLKIVALGPVDQELLKGVGAVPVFFMINQVADSMQKGVVDGAFNPASTSVRFKVYEAAEYYIRFAEPALGQDPGFAITMNLDTWNKLPPDIQKIFLEVREEYPIKFAEFDKKDTEEAYGIIKKSGTKIIEFPASETKRWKALIDLKEMDEGWIRETLKRTDVSEQRLRQILARYKELLEEMPEKYPQSW